MWTRSFNTANRGSSRSSDGSRRLRLVPLLTRRSPLGACNCAAGFDDVVHGLITRRLENCIGQAGRDDAHLLKA